MMHESLFKYINSYITAPLKGTELELVKKAFVLKKIEKKQYFPQEGEVRCANTLHYR
jgi:hypothetical protein